MRARLSVGVTVFSLASLSEACPVCHTATGEQVLKLVNAEHPSIPTAETHVWLGWIMPVVLV